MESLLDLTKAVVLNTVVTLVPQPRVHLEEQGHQAALRRWVQGR